MVCHYCQSPIMKKMVSSGDPTHLDGSPLCHHMPECVGLQWAYQVPYCVCHALSSVQERVTKTTTHAWERFSRDQFDAGFSEGLDAAAKAVDAISAPYKIKGQYETYFPYNEGMSDLKDVALSAIDALRKESND